MNADERAQLSAADWYEHRAHELRMDTEHNPEDVAIALEIIAHARRAELLDAEPSPYTFGGYDR